MASFDFETNNQALYDAIAGFDTINFSQFFNLLTDRLTKKDSK